MRPIVFFLNYSSLILGEAENVRETATSKSFSERGPICISH
jgi:hypothetical protein